MGLDITAYTRLSVPEGVTYDNEGTFHNAAGEDLGWDAPYVTFYENPDFPGRAEGIKCDRETVYEYANSHAFRAGSYGGYNSWRDALAELAGYPSFQIDVYGGKRDSHAAACWSEGGGLAGPFNELINFSDCEGTIGPVVAAKLAKDFEIFEPIAREQWDNSEKRYYFERYLDWKQAFEYAADNGAVVFS